MTSRVPASDPPFKLDPLIIPALEMAAVFAVADKRGGLATLFATGVAGVLIVFLWWMS